MITGPPPIRTDVYFDMAADDELLQARVADKARILFIILYRLGLVSNESAADHVVSKWRLQSFGHRWRRWCARCSAGTGIKKKSNENI